MKRFFLDTNILLDFLGGRQPFVKNALKIFNKGRLGEWELWTSSYAILTSYFILRREIGTNAAKSSIGGLLKLVKVQAIQKSDLLHSLSSSIQDFEDGAQHSCAISIGNIDGIITRDRKDFKHSQLKVYNPSELFSD